MESQFTYNINNNKAQNTTHPNGKHFKSEVINYWSVIDIDQIRIIQSIEPLSVLSCKLYLPYISISNECKNKLIEKIG